jgi:hypothetical protein
MATPPFQTQDVPDVLPAFLKGVLDSDSYYADVPIVVVEPTDTPQKLLQSLSVLNAKNGSCGVVLYVMPVTQILDEYADVPDGPLKVLVQFQCWEALEKKEWQTGNSKSALNVAQHTFRLFKCRSIGHVLKVMNAGTPAIEAGNPPEGVLIRGWVVNFSALEDAPDAPDACAFPVFSQAGGAGTDVSISCATSGAEIYYTTDGSCPDREHGTLYTGSISVAAGAITLFAMAQKTGYLPSNMNAAQFS